MTVGTEALLSHQGFVRALARSLVFDENLAADIAQDTFVAALEHPPSREGGLRTWLGRVTHNFARQSSRATRRRAARELASARPESVVPSPEEILERESTRRRVVDAVLTLPKPYRDVVLLRFYEDLPPREIAARLRLPADTVRTRIRRGLEQLRRRLDDVHGGDRRAWMTALLPLARGPRPLARVPRPQALGLAAAVATLTVVTVGSLLTRKPTAPSPGASAEAPSIEAAAVVVAKLDEAAAGVPVERAPLAATTTAASASSARTASVRVRAIWSHDRSPASGIAFALIPYSAPDPMIRRVHGLTGADGTFEFTDVPPGDFKAWPDRCDPALLGPGAVARPAERCEVTYEIDPGIAIEGMVVDEAGRPVADAGVWVSFHDEVPNGEIVERTDGAGRFALRGLRSHQRIGARASGRAPSLLLPVREGESPIRIVLDQPGGAVEGKVLGPDGAPTAGALVTVGPEPPARRAGEDRRPVSAPQATARTDRSGAFRIEGVATGDAPVWVLAPGHSPWKGSVSVRAGDVARLDVRLPWGPRVTGVVRDAGGSAVAQAQVVVRGAADAAPSVAWSFTGSDGAYRVECVPTGALTVWAMGRGGEWAVAHLAAAPGQILEWSPRLASSQRIVGRIVDDAGAPLPYWRLAARSTRVVDDRWKAVTSTDPDGRFSFAGVADGPIRLEASDPATPFGYPSAAVNDVRTDGTEVVLRIPSSAFATATIAGTVVDARTTPADDIKVYLWQRGSLETGCWGRTIDPRTGRFEIGPVPPGEYHVDVRSDDRTCLGLDAQRLAPCERLDLGTLRIQDPGELRMTARRPSDGGIGALAVGLRDPKGWSIGSWRVDAPTPDGLFRVAVPNLAPGRYVVRVRDCEFAPLDRAFAAEPGRTTSLDLELAPGVVRTLVFASPSTAAPPASIRFLVKSAGDPRVLDEQLAFAGSEPREHRVSLAPGTYRVEARAGALFGEASFSTADDREGGTVVVTLR